MRINLNHSWGKTVVEAKAIQKQLWHQVITTDCLNSVRYVAGVDINFENNYAISQAAIAILTYPELELVELEPPSRPATGGSMVNMNQCL